MKTTPTTRPTLNGDTGGLIVGPPLGLIVGSIVGRSIVGLLIVGPPLELIVGSIVGRGVGGGGNSAS